jgi:hypothetical protein
MDPFTVARLWVFIKPVKRIRNRRRAKRGLPPLSDREVAMPEVTKVILPDGTEGVRTEPIIPARTSSKIAVGNGVVAAFPAVEVLQYIQSLELPIDWLEALTNSDYFIYYGSLAISYLIARYTKSPTVKTAL